MSANPVFVSKTWFDRLSPENQAALLEAGQKFADKWNNEIWPSADAAGLKVLKEKGMEILDVDKEQFKAKVKPFVDEFLADASDEQKEFYNLLVTTFVDEFLADASDEQKEFYNLLVTTRQKY